MRPLFTFHPATLETLMRLTHTAFVFLSLFMIPLAGCGGSSATQAPDASEVESYVQSNAEAMAHQAALDAEREKTADEDE